MSECGACRAGWAEVVSQTYGRYFRRCACWHHARIEEAIALGLSRAAAMRREALEAKRYEPTGAQP